MSVSKRADLESYIKRPDSRIRAILIHGPDRISVQDFGKRVLAVSTQRPDDPFDVARLSAAELEAERLEAELAALSLRGGRRVVHVRSDADLGARERTLAEALSGHVETPRSETLMLIETGSLDRRSVLRKAAEGGPRALSLALYENEAADLGKMAGEMLERDGLRVAPEVRRILTALLPRDRGVAQQLVETLILYVGPTSGGRVEEADLMSVLGTEAFSIGSETALFAFSGQRREVAAALGTAKLRGETGTAILRQLSLHRGKLARAQTAIASGANPAVALKGVGVFWKHEQQLLSQLALWRMEALDRARTDLLAAEMACKRAGAPDDLIAHRAALEITDSAVKCARRG